MSRRLCGGSSGRGIPVDVSHVTWAEPSGRSICWNWCFPLLLDTNSFSSVSLSWSAAISAQLKASLVTCRISGGKTMLASDAGGDSPGNLLSVSATGLFFPETCCMSVENSDTAARCLPCLALAGSDCFLMARVSGLWSV